MQSHVTKRLHHVEYFMKTNTIKAKVPITSFSFPPALKLHKKSCYHKCEHSSDARCCSCANPKRKPKCRYCQFKTFESLGGKTWLSFHGTSKQSAQAILSGGFIPSGNGSFGPGVYVSANPSTSTAYVKGNDGVILACLVKPGKIKRITSKSAGSQTTWHQEGCNSSYAGSDYAGMEEVCIFNPGRVYAWAIISWGIWQWSQLCWFFRRALWCFYLLILTLCILVRWSVCNCS